MSIGYGVSKLCEIKFRNFHQKSDIGIQMQCDMAQFQISGCFTRQLQ